MEIQLLASMGKVAGIAGLSLGIFFLVVSQSLKKQFLNAFPVEMAAKMVIITLTLTWSIAVLGVLVSFNSDISKAAKNAEEYSDSNVATTTSVESRSSVYSGVDKPSVNFRTTNAETKFDQKNKGAYKSTNIVSSKTQVESKKSEEIGIQAERKKAESSVSWISISFLNSIFTIVFSVFLVWLIFVASVFIYNNFIVKKGART